MKLLIPEAEEVQWNRKTEAIVLCLQWVQPKLDAETIQWCNSICLPVQPCSIWQTMVQPCCQSHSYSIQVCGWLSGRHFFFWLKHIDTKTAIMNVPPSIRGDWVKHTVYHSLFTQRPFVPQYTANSALSGGRSQSCAHAQRSGQHSTLRSMHSVISWRTHCPRGVAS